MPILESLEPQRQSSPHRKSSSLSPRDSKMQPEAMDLLKNPFLLPAQLMALNPSLYAAQLAQLQAAQLLLAKQQAETSRNGDLSRKRSMDEEAPLDLGSKPKYPRSLSPNERGSEASSESPLDLSGNKSPEVKRELNSFNPLMPPGLLSFFSQLKPPTSSQDLPNMMGFSPTKSSPPSPGQTARNSSTWQSQWVNKG